ncbi:MAG TPA: type II toxin-antitoxin system RelE/ParE family toxin [bacterium]|nr:type II toxin-antitoxin system RelE/ParE family toxin [bacterium]
MPYTVEFTIKADRELALLPSKDQERIVRKLSALAQNPLPHGAAPLKGELKGHYRIRIGVYRAVYCIRKDVLVVVVVRVGHRREVYDRFN